jgi:serine/threonine protein phosphatase 1
VRLFRSREIRPRARIQDDLRLYVVGDVHGSVDLLEALLAQIDADRLRRPCDQDAVILIGDYIDRGPASREVLDLLISRVGLHKTVMLKGNHESYLIEFLDNPAILRDWRQYGGLQTLMSYGLKPSINPDEREQAELARELNSRLPWSHRALLGALPTSFSVGDFFFAHAGVRPGVPLDSQKDQDLLWIRNDFLVCEDDFGKVVVHGHTPVPEIDIRPNRINIDTGAYATGRLACLNIEGDKVDAMAPR